MSALREAAQQALEALEYRDGDGADQWKADVITALRAALAQEPVATTQQPAGDTPPSDYRRGYCDGFAIGKREGCIEAEDAAKQAEPKGGGNLPPPLQAEPVAWLYEAGTERTLHWHKPPLYGTPLYTAPPQRQPLTQEESDNIYREFMLYQDRLTPSVLQRVVRAIERAHGIIESEIKVDSHQTLDDAMRLPRAMAQAYESGYNAGAAAERKRIIQFLNEMQRQVGDGHNHYGVAAMRIRERV